MNELDLSYSNIKSNSGKSDHLENDSALKAFLSKEVKNDSPAFKDYPPTTALIRAANNDFLKTIGIKR